MKPTLHALLLHLEYVTPHTGVWIETNLAAILLLICPVTPHTGVWIETKNQKDIKIWK